MNKSLYHRLVLFCFILILPACNGNDSSQIDVSEEKVSLEFFTPKAETEAVFEELIKDFEEQNPAIDINQVVMPNGGMEILKARVARGDIPDIFVTYPIEEDYQIRAEKGYLLNLTGEEFIESIESEIQNRYLINGRMYGIALTQNAVGVLYNKDIFSKLNIAVPDTWNEFILTLEKLEAAGHTGIVMPNKEADQTSVFILNLVANEFTRDYWNKEEFSIPDNNNWREIAEKSLKVLNYVQPDAEETYYHEANQKFANGEGGMYVMGTWVLPQIESLNPGLNYGIFPFPATNRPGENKVLGGVDIGLAVSAETEHPEEAKKFLEFLTERKNAERLSEYEGSISTVTGVGISREETSPLYEKIKKGKSVNWPNHYWAGGTAAESDFRNYTLQFFYEKDIGQYLINIESVLERYNAEE